MTWEIFLGIAALLTFVIAIVRPITRLTSAVTELTCSVKSLNKRFDENRTFTDKRLEAHGKKIDDLEKRMTKSEQFQENIKEKVDFFHGS